VGRNAFSHSTCEVEKSPKNKNPAQKGQGFFWLKGLPFDHEHMPCAIDVVGEVLG
jgi:hypothetical protein